MLKRRFWIPWRPGEPFLTEPTVPARLAFRPGAAIHTGMSQSGHKRVGYADGVDWNYDYTLAGELTKAGYYTQCIGKMHVHPLRNLIGFNHVELHDGYLHYYRYSSTPYYEAQKVADDYMYWLKHEKGIEADVIDTGMECNSWVARPWIYDERTHPTNWVTSPVHRFSAAQGSVQTFFSDGLLFKTPIPLLMHQNIILICIMP